jgi:hypothetical protein
LGFDTDDFQDAGALIRASLTVSGQAAQLAFSGRLVEEPLLTLRKLQLPYRPFLSARIATTVLLHDFTRRVAPKRSSEAGAATPWIRCVAMDHHFQAPLAEAKGVSTSSAKPETLAVQYWTIAERKAAGRAGCFGDRSDRALFYCVLYHCGAAT